MESLLGFMGSPPNDVVEPTSYVHKLVPWISWDEWNFVRESLFSSSPLSVDSALKRILAWRSRGCVPVLVDITASIIEIQQKDSYFRDDLPDNALHSEEMLSMLYSMAIIRLVNGALEKTRKKEEVSIADAADLIGIPRMLIDIRHEGSHRDLPSLRLVRSASVKALDWLKSYYWEPQNRAIQFQSDERADINKEIKSKLHELALSLKVKQTTQPSSSPGQGKRSKKETRKMIKIVTRLYSSFSSEVVSVLLELLQKALCSLELVKSSNSSEVSHSESSLQTMLDDWKRVTVKLAHKEPDLLLNLFKAILEVIESKEVSICEMGKHLSSEHGAVFSRVGQLSSVCKWLAGVLKELKHTHHTVSTTETEGTSSKLYLPNIMLVDLLRKCLAVSSLGNNQLIDSALVLAHIMGDSSLIKKLDKLSALKLLDSDPNDKSSSLYRSSSFESFLSQQQEYINQAAQKLEQCKSRAMKSCSVDKRDSKWVVAKSWKLCPIGLLPTPLGSSGQVPVLDCNDDLSELFKSSESQEERELTQCSGKREADSSIELIDNSTVKKMRLSESGYEPNSIHDSVSEDFKGQLRIGGFWKKVREEELLAIASAVRILV